MTPEEKRAHLDRNNKNRRAKYAEKKFAPDNMLRDFLRATTPAQKRKVIRSFAPHYFILGDRLDPKTQATTDEGETS